MKRLAWAYLEAIFDELLILGIDSPLAYFGASVTVVAENGVPETAHVHPYLVSAAGFKAALYQRHEAITLKHTPVSNCMFPFLRIRGNAEAEAV